MFIIKKEIIDGIEYLPDIVDTDLFKSLEQAEYSGKELKQLRIIAGLYKALSERENYFQYNTPTAFGNPEYQLFVGTVNGFVQGADLIMDEDDEHFIIKRGKKTVLIVDKIKRNPEYYDARREATKALNDILGG